MSSEMWKYIDGERVQLPITSRQAEDLGWIQVRFAKEYGWGYNGNFDTLDEINLWCDEHIENKLYLLGGYDVFVAAETDATMVRLRWA